MSTKDQTHSARLHGEALLAAQADSFRELLDHVADLDVTPTERATIAGALAGGAFADLAPGADYAEIGRHLIAAGLVLGSGVVDRDRLAEAVAEGYAGETS